MAEKETLSLEKNYESKLNYETFRVYDYTNRYLRFVENKNVSNYWNISSHHILQEIIFPFNKIIFESFYDLKKLDMFLKDFRLQNLFFFDLFLNAFVNLFKV